MEEESFKFEEVSEEEEKLDFENLASCPHCKKPIPCDATMCLYCGKEVLAKKKSARFVWTVVLLIIVLVLFLLF
jgi:predicted nucleic acid-binding Zn ribbon protein